MAHKSYYLKLIPIDKGVPPIIEPLFHMVKSIKPKNIISKKYR